MSDVSIIEEQVKESPYFLDFSKKDLIDFHPTLPNLNYDPFPDAKDYDIVSHEYAGQVLHWRATFKGFNHDLRPGMNVVRKGRTFMISRVTFASHDESMTIEGDELPSIDSIAILSGLRRRLAESNVK